METKENNNTARYPSRESTEIEEASPLANRCQPIRNSYPYLGNNSSDLPLFELQTDGNQ